MSRNFELLEQIEREQERPAPVPIATPPVNATNASPGSFDPNAYAKGETSKLVQRIFWSPTRQDVRAVVFCGADQSEGCSSICLDAARELASRISDSVCVLSARSWKDGGDENSVFDSTSWSQNAHQVERNVWTLPAGHLFSGNRLSSAPTLRLQVDQLRKAFAYVVIDAPPVVDCSDTALLARLADGVVLVIEANVTRKTVVRTAKETLEAAGAHFVGVVLNNRTFPIPESLYRRL